MATFKEALTTSLTNFSKSIAKTYIKTANIVDNLLSTDSTLPLSAKQGNVLQTQISTLNSNLGDMQHVKRINFSAGNSSKCSLKTNSVYLLITGHPLRSAASGMYLISYNSNDYYVITPILSSEYIALSIADGILTVDCSGTNAMAFVALYKVIY